MKKCTAYCYNMPYYIIIIVCDDTFKDYHIMGIKNKLLYIKQQRELYEYIKSNQYPSDDMIAKTQEKVDEIKEVMLHNIDKVMKRGETVESLAEKSKELEAQSVVLLSTTKKLN